MKRVKFRHRLSYPINNKCLVSRVILLLVITLSSVHSLAQPSYPDSNFGLYMRSDLELNQSDSTSDLNSNEDSNKFKFNYLRINFKGHLDDKTSYRVRYRLDKTLATSERIDGTGDGVNYAYIDRVLTDKLKVRLGKQYFAGACGREGDYSGQDVYLYSLTCDQNPFYKTGIALMPSYGGQSFIFSIVNPDDKSSNQSDFGYSATWYGNLYEGIFEPIFSYIYFPLTEQRDSNTGIVTAKSATNSFVSLGTRFTKGMVQLEADYMQANFEARNTTTEDKIYDTIALQARFFFDEGKMQPLVKYETSSFDDGNKNNGATDGAFDRHAYTVALEYYPNHGKKGADWRVHAAFWQTTDSYDKPNTPDLVTSQFLLGFSLRFTGG